VNIGGGSKTEVLVVNKFCYPGDVLSVHGSADRDCDRLIVGFSV